MIPRWKLRREVDRLKQQVRAAASWPLEPYWIWRHDRAFSTVTRITLGAQPAGRKIALFLIYQPRGLLGSTLETCRRFHDAGYSMLVVSNAALSESERAELAPLCWRIAERPNFGYDFGGYRDGWRIVREAGLDLDAMMVLNDSIWWPVFEADDLLARLEGAGADVVRTINHAQSHLLLNRTRPDFMESYLFWFSRAALKSDAFAAFWRSYRVSSIKYNAVYRGERRLTGCMAAGGLSVRALFDADRLIDALRRAGPAETLLALRYGAYVDPEFIAGAQKVLARDPTAPDWHAAALDFIGVLVRKRGFHASLPCASMRLLGANFIKKAPAQANNSLQHVMRERIMAAVDDGVLPPLLPVVRAEMEDARRRGALAVGR